MARGTTVRELVTKWMFKVDDNQLKKADRQIEELKTQASSLTGLITKIGAGFAAAGVGVGYFLKEAGDIEQVEIAFETMLQDADKAKVLMKDITQFAATTPFELKGLLKSTKQLMAYNFEAEEIIPTMTALGNIAAGVGREKLPNLILALGQVRAATRLTGQETRQFTEAGVPVFDMLSKKLGKPAAEIKDLISQGAVSYDIFNEALQDLANGSGRFSGLMMKQSKTLLGLFSNFIDVLQITAAEIGKEILPVAKEYLMMMLDWIEVNKEFIKGKFVAYIKILGVAFGDFLSIAKSVIFTVNQISRVFGGMENMIRLTFKALAFLVGAKMLLMLGKFAMAIKSIGTVSLIAQAKAMAIPLAIGAAILGTMLLVDDFIHWINGKPSLLGHFMGDYDDFDLGKMIGFDANDLVQFTNDLGKNLSEMGSSFADWLFDSEASSAAEWATTVAKKIGETIRNVLIDFVKGIGVIDLSPEEQKQADEYRRKDDAMRDRLAKEHDELSNARDRAGYNVFGSFVEDMLMGVGIMDKSPALASSSFGPLRQSSIVNNNNITANITVPPHMNREDAEIFARSTFITQFNEQIKQVDVAASTNIER